MVARTAMPRPSGLQVVTDRHSGGLRQVAELRAVAHQQVDALPFDELELLVELLGTRDPDGGEPAGIPPDDELAALLSDHQDISESEHRAAAFLALKLSFDRRQELLSDALTTAQVKELLHTSRQTPHDRANSGSLLGVMHKGAMRFPCWQFDPDGPDGVVAGLPRVVRALPLPPLAKVSWLTRPNPALDHQTPLARLKAGDVDRVEAIARLIGAL